MNRTRTVRLSWTLPIVMFAAVALGANATTALGQTPAYPAAQNSMPTITLSGPKGDRLTLVHSQEGGWQLQAGWPAVPADDSFRMTEAVFSDVVPTAADDRPVLESPLSVYIDGPTGFTFIYVLDEGWKFVGQVAGSAR
jgi:hypothetical protein